MRPTALERAAARADIAWEECSCPLCGSPRHVPLLEAADARMPQLRFLIVQCCGCGLCFTNPRPDPASIRRFYPADYRCHLGKESRGSRAAELQRFLFRRGQARLLDFGCGAGDFLARMHALGWNAVGLDAAEVAVTHVRDRFGLTAHLGSLPHPELDAGSFEAITMRQSLEHVHQPLDTLCAAHRLLVPGGTLLITVPNFGSLAARWFGPSWYGLDVPRHLTHFTPDSLEMMLRRAGFTQVTIMQERHPSWLRHSAKNIRGWWASAMRTRLGSGAASWWGQVLRRADGLIAVAVRA